MTKKKEIIVPVVNPVMEKLLADSAVPPIPGDTVEGPVIALGSGKVYIGLLPFGTGIIYGREYLSCATCCARLRSATPSQRRSSARRTKKDT